MVSDNDAVDCAKRPGRMVRPGRTGLVIAIVATALGCGSSKGGGGNALDEIPSGGSNAKPEAGNAGNAGSGGREESGSQAGDAGSDSDPDAAGAAGARSVSTWGRWTGVTSDDTPVSFRVGGRGTFVADMTLTYHSGCDVDVTQGIEPLPIDGMSFDGASNFVVVAGTREENPYRQLHQSFVSDDQAEGSYWYAGAEVTSTESVCVSFERDQCLSWELVDQSRCISSAEGTWSASPVCSHPIGPEVLRDGPRLAIVLDKSGSMGGQYGDADQRWNPTVAGVLDFLSNPGSPVQASLHLFPSSADPETACLNDYSVADVPTTPLPNAEAFTSVLAAVVPEGGSPTLQALQGAYLSLANLQDETETVSSAVVVITDGDPVASDPTQPPVAACESDPVDPFTDVLSIAESMNSACPYILTYALGIGPNSTWVGILADAANTPASMFSGAEGPAATQSRVADALRSIAAAL